MATRLPVLPSRRAMACMARLNAARSIPCWPLAAMAARQKGGKAFLTLGEGETVCVPSHAAGSTGSKPVLPATHVACASTGGRILTFEITELKTMVNGGRGLMLIDLEDKDQLA